MPCNHAIVVIRYAEIEQDIEEESEIEQCEINPVLLCGDGILNAPVDAENPE